MARHVVCLTFDFDALSAWIFRGGTTPTVPPATLPQLGVVTAGPGEIANSFDVTAPFKPGTYNFQWRMLQELVEWFGDLTTNKTIIVTKESTM